MKRVWASQNASTNTWYNLVACCSACKNIRMDTVQWFCAIKMLTLLLLLPLFLIVFCCFHVDHVFLLQNKMGCIMPVCAGFRNFFSRATFLATDVSKSQSRHTHIIHRAHLLLSFFYSLPPHLSISHWICSVRSFDRSVGLSSVLFHSSRLYGHDPLSMPEFTELKATRIRWTNDYPIWAHHCKRKAE